MPSLGDELETASGRGRYEQPPRYSRLTPRLKGLTAPHDGSGE